MNNNLENEKIKSDYYKSGNKTKEKSNDALN